MTPRLLSRKETAQYLGLTPGTLDARVKDGILPKPLTLGKRNLYDIKAYDVALDIMSGIAAPSGDAIMESLKKCGTNG